MCRIRTLVILREQTFNFCIQDSLIHVGLGCMANGKHLKNQAENSSHNFDVEATNHAKQATTPTNSQP